MSAWGIDLGTTNSCLARWNREGQYPEMLHLESICRLPQHEQKLEVKYTVPSSLFVLPGQDWKSKVGAWPFVQRRMFLGTNALIGRAAQERDAGLQMPNYIPTFKQHLLRDGYRTVAKIGSQTITARQAATMYLRELLATVKAVTGERPRHVTFGTPVDSYEPYRAQLAQIASSLGIHHFRTIDEPIAAAIGYNLLVDHARALRVFDFGGGTLDLALIRMDERKVEEGRCEVVAKEGVPIGGNLVDAWMVEEFCRRLGYQLSIDDEDAHVTWWYRIMLEEACRVKEGLFFRPTGAFFLEPPREMQRLRHQFPRGGTQIGDPMQFTRDDLVEILRERGLYDAIDRLIDAVLRRGRERGVAEHEIADVLMVGGSTLLPEVYPRIEARFGRDRLRAWQPFDAVAYGASAFAGGHLVRSDFITHDYAFVTYRKDSHDPEYHVIIPGGTTFPTAPDLWKRQLTPTCPLGEPERIFKLVVAELGQRHGSKQEFTWDAGGQLHSLEERGRKPVVIPLNESNPTMGYLEPPHPPSERSARLEVAFGVNPDRWLVATVFDLKTRKHLMVETPVVRLK